MCRVAFEFLSEADLHEARLPVANDLGIAFRDSNQHSAAGRTKGTDAGFPLRDAGDQVFLRHEANELIFRIAAARERGAGAGDRRELDEVAPFHGQKWQVRQSFGACFDL